MYNIYPFVLNPTDNGSCVTSNPLGKDLWLKHKERFPEKREWYAVGLMVHSPEKVTVQVYDMADSFNGGIGQVICTFNPDLTAVEKLLLSELICEEQTFYATAIFEEEEKARKENAIEALRQSLFGDI